MNSEQMPEQEEEKNRLFVILPLTWDIDLFGSGQDWRVHAASPLKGRERED